MAKSSHAARTAGVDVSTGSTMNVPGYGVASYPVKVVDGKI
jgi:hypothetical protein